MPRKAKPTNGKKTKPPAPATMTSVISYLEEILGIVTSTDAKVTAQGQQLSVLTEQSGEILAIVTENKTISLATLAKLGDIETEMAAQAETLARIDETTQKTLEAIQGPFVPTTDSDLTQTT